MNPFVSFLSGFFGVSLVSFLLRVAIETRATTAASLVTVLALLGIGFLVSAVLPRVEHRGVRIVAAILFVAMVMILRGSIDSIRAADSTWVFGAMVVVGCVLFRLQGGDAADPAHVLLGAALGLVAQESVFLPMFSFGDWFVLSAVLLCAARQIAHVTEGFASRADDEDDERGFVARIVEPALVGLAIGFAFALARPIVLQQTSGTRFSHELVGAVILFGLALGAFVRFGRTPGGLARAVTGIIAVGALALMLRVQLLRGSDALALRNTWLGDHPIGSEFRAAQNLVGLGAVAAGLWLTNVFGARLRPASAAFALLAGALGALSANHCLAQNARAWPATVLGDSRRLVREGAIEIYASHGFSEDGVLRAVRNMTQAEGAHHLQWHNRRATRNPAFAGLEAQEIASTSELSNGASLLIVGNATLHHRDAIGGATFSSYVLAPTIPILDVEALGDERRSTIPALLREGAKFDAITFVSTPVLNDEAARMLTRERFRDAKTLLDEGGTVLVWLDPLGIEPSAISAVARAFAATFGTLRCWIALDGFAGPFIGLEAGPARPAEDTAFRAQIPAQALTDDGGTRIDSIGDPVAELMRPTEKSDVPLASGERLRWLAQRVRATSGGNAVLEALAFTVEATAQHSDEYFEVEILNARNERDRLSTAQTDLIAKAFATAPHHPLVRQATISLLVLAYTKKNYELCDRVLVPALEAFPDDDALRLISGRVNYDLLDDEAAIEDLETVIRTGNATAEAYRVLGQAYHRSKEISAALSALNTALQLAPEDPAVLRALGLCLADSPQPEQAIPFLQRVITVNPKDRDVRAKLVHLQPEAVLPQEPPASGDFPHNDG